MAEVGIIAREQALLNREAGQARARDRRQTVKVLGWQVVLLAAVLVSWHTASGRVLDRLFLSNPVNVAQAFWRILVDGSLWYHLRFTLIETLLGYIAGAGLGLGAALAVSLAGTMEEVLRPYIIIAFAVPKIALAPLIIVWFGIGLLPKVLLAAIFVFFIVFLNSLGGIATVSPGLIAVMRVMGASPATIFRKVVLPNAVPFIATALRIAIPAAMIGAIVGEFISSNRGVGYLINAASSRYRTAEVFAGIFSLLLAVLLMNAVVSALERHWLRWAPKHEDPFGRR